MATGDPGGQIAQALHDRMSCLVMEVTESVREKVAEFEKEFPDLKRQA